MGWGGVGWGKVGWGGVGWGGVGWGGVGWGKVGWGGVGWGGVGWGGVGPLAEVLVPPQNIPSLKPIDLRVKGFPGGVLLLALLFFEDVAPIQIEVAVDATALALLLAALLTLFVPLEHGHVQHGPGESSGRGTSCKSDRVHLPFG